jgi:hypothetical protein
VPRQPERADAIERRAYLIDHFQVTFQSGAAWRCSCREFAFASACRHTREAAGMHEAQTRMLRHVRGGLSGLGSYNVRSR